MARDEHLRVGDRVSHKVFGEGLVLEMSGEGDRQNVLVSFSSDRSQRRLMTRYANLTKVEKREKPEKPEKPEKKG